MKHTVRLIPALSDNYIYLIQWDKNAAVIDPAVAVPVREVLEEEKLGLKFILNTHHHFDHVGGNTELKGYAGCPVIGPDDNRIPGLDETVGEGDTLEVGPFRFSVYAVPAHTTTHIALYEPEQKWLFSGDSLFCGGCGRLFEGSAEEMYHSLQKLVMLPKETKVYCGHEYTVSNLEFAHSIEPENVEVKRRLDEVKQIREEGGPTIPSTLDSELITNPFLRVSDPKLRKALQMENASDIEIFSHIRSLKDHF